MQRGVFIGVGVLAITLVAGGLTEATLARGDRAGLSDGSVAVASPKVTPKPSTTPQASAAPSPTPAPAVTPVLPSGAPTATTNSFVHLRAAASINSAIVTDLNGGTVVTLGDYEDSQWQQVSVNGLNGYIYRSYLAY